MKNHICPKCNSADIQRGLMRATVGQVYLYPENNLRKKPSSISAEYCKDCGYILSFYVDNPENLGP